VNGNALAEGSWVVQLPAASWGGGWSIDVRREIDINIYIYIWTGNLILSSTPPL